MTKNIFVVAIPVIIALTFALLVQIVNIAFVGHLEDDSEAKVAGVGLGNLYLNMFC
jgi:Na+-driven multidrug efflux pump